VGVVEREVEMRLYMQVELAVQEGEEMAQEFLEIK
jgi:hypothetical protein